GDVKELGAIQELFGDNSPAISATKAMTGHALGAAGVHEAIFSLLMLENNFVAPSINIDELDEQAQGLDIVTERRDVELNTVMSNSFGFGGTNATLV
ncbi:beta-ketoacyl-[acyl-carrier-protein] synthase I, partial [Pseudoalteromonas ruthenica]